MAINNSLMQKKSEVGFTAYLTREAVKNQITKVVGGKNSTRFISNIISAVQINPQLQECTNNSILSAALQAESLKLPPSPQLGFVWMVPFNNKKKGVKEAQFIVSAKGYKQLAMRSGQYIDIDCIYIKEGEYKGRDKYTGKQKFEFIEDDDERESLPVIGYLAYLETKDGFKKQLYWSKSKMEKHADKYSQAFSLKAAKLLEEGKIPQNELWKYSSYWYTSFDEMAEKTMIKQLLSKWAMLTPDITDALESDNTTVSEDGNRNYIEMESPALNAEMPTVDTTATEESVQEQPVPDQQQDINDILFS